MSPSLVSQAFSVHFADKKPRYCAILRVALVTGVVMSS